MQCFGANDFFKEYLKVRILLRKLSYQRLNVTQQTRDLRARSAESGPDGGRRGGGGGGRIGYMGGERANDSLAKQTRHSAAEGKRRRDGVNDGERGDRRCGGPTDDTEHKEGGRGGQIEGSASLYSRWSSNHGGEEREALLCNDGTLKR